MIHSIHDKLRPLAPMARKVLGSKLYRDLKEAVLANKKYDEVDVVFRAIGRARKDRGLMIDVGGHHGESFEKFAEFGWSVHCFEPNPANHPIIRSRIAEARGDVTLHPFAVSDTAKQGLKFFLSDVSSGISSLHPFHESHQEALTVDVVSLSEQLALHGNPVVDFLKIDTEGFDLFVLKGLDWDVVKPEIIVCEFEDSKTKELGYDYKDMAQYLVERGYEVIVSEWRPVAAYGQAHDWNRYTRFPSELTTPHAWGNLVALRPGAGAEAVKAELRKIGDIG